MAAANMLPFGYYSLILQSESFIASSEVTCAGAITHPFPHKQVVPSLPLSKKEKGMFMYTGARRARWQIP